jgi:hypothetical protein
MSNNLISALQNFSMFMQNRQEATRRMLLYEAEKVQQTRGRQEAYQILEKFKENVTSPEDMPQATLDAHSMAFSSANPYTIQAFQQAMPMVAGQMATGMETAAQEKLLGQAFETMKDQEMVINGETVTLEEYKRMSGTDNYRDFYKLLDVTKGSMAKPVHFFDPQTIGKGDTNRVVTTSVNSLGQFGESKVREFKVDQGIPMVKENGKWVQDSEGIYGQYMEQLSGAVDQKLKNLRIRGAEAELTLKGIEIQKGGIELTEALNESAYGYKNVDEQIRAKRGLIKDVDDHITELEYRVGGVVQLIMNKDISDKQREMLGKYMDLSASELRGPKGQEYMNQLMTIAASTKEAEGHIRKLGQQATTTIYSDLMGGQSGSILGSLGSSQVPTDSTIVSNTIAVKDSTEPDSIKAAADTTSQKAAKAASPEANPVNKLQTSLSQAQEIVDFWKDPLNKAASGYNYEDDSGGKALHFLLNSLERSLAERELLRASKGDLAWDKKQLVWEATNDFGSSLRDLGINQGIEQIRDVKGEEVEAYYKNLQSKKDANAK